nr:cytochrome B-C1 complex subunit 9-like [Ipomoea batatas]
METTAARRNGGGMLEGLYRVIMRRNSVYVTFVVVGAFLGERAVDYGVHKLWENNNVGVMIPSILYSYSLTMCYFLIKFIGKNTKEITYGVLDLII